MGRANLRFFFLYFYILLWYTFPSIFCFGLYKVFFSSTQLLSILTLALLVMFFFWVRMELHQIRETYFFWWASLPLGGRSNPLSRGTSGFYQFCSNLFQPVSWCSATEPSSVTWQCYILLLSALSLAIYHLYLWIIMENALGLWIMLPTYG